MTEEHRRRTKERGESFYCPRGHVMVWTGKTAEQKLRDAEARNRHLEDQLQASGSEAEALRVALLRDRQRFANGVCPCCNRSFTALARHMRSKHPDYDITKVDTDRGHRFRCSCHREFDTLRGLRIHQGHWRDDSWSSPLTPKWRAHLTVV